jgi:hypothetical protein
MLDDPRAADPECGHYLTPEHAYEALANRIVYRAKQKRKEEGRYVHRDIEYRMLRERRLARWLQWLDKRNQEIKELMDKWLHCPFCGGLLAMDECVLEKCFRCGKDLKNA